MGAARERIFLPLLLDAWTDPAGTPTTPDERERIVAGLWSVARDAGVSGLLEHRPDGVEIARRLHPPDRVRIAERTPFLDYMELGRTLTLPLARERTAPFQASVRIDAHATWTTGSVVTAEDRARIVPRLRENGIRVEQ